MRFGDIRRILDKATEDCIDCHDEDCHYDCSYYVAKLIKEEILNLLDQEQIQTDPINSIPCKLNYKGMCSLLPTDNKDGDLWYVQDPSEIYKNGNYYWYNNKWNYLPILSVIYKIKSI